MNQREHEKVARLIARIEKEKGKQAAASSQDGGDKPTNSRKRKRSSTGALNERWVNSGLEPLMRCLTANPNFKFQRWNHHSRILQVPLPPNDINEENLFTHFENTVPFAVGLPVPLHVARSHEPSEPDLMVRFLFAKEVYCRELSYTYAAYHRIQSRPAARGLLKQSERNEQETIQNSAAVVYAALLDQDPDPYLSLQVGYDYHFTGGAMATVGSTYADGSAAAVFKAVGESLERLELIHLVPLGDGIGEPKGVCDIQLQENSTDPIQEIIADGDARCVLIRKRLVVVVLQEKAKAGCESKWHPIGRIRSTVPFASVCIASKKPLIVCTTDYRSRLQLWRIEPRKADTAKRLWEQNLPQVDLSHEQQGWPNVAGNEAMKDNWSAVRSLDDRKMLVCLDRHRIHLYSVEGGPPDDAIRLTYRKRANLTRWTMACERFCALETFPEENLIFIASCHKVCVARLEYVSRTDQSNARENDSKKRKQESSSSSSSEKSASFSTSHATSASESNAIIPSMNVLVVFAHNLHQRPVFLSHQRQRTGKAGGNDHHFLLFGSHLPMSYGVYYFAAEAIKGEGEKDSEHLKYLTRHLPLQPRTFDDAYKMAQNRGFCLSADDPLRRRFYACQSALTLVPGGESGTLHILLQTSAGDLLQQQITIGKSVSDPGEEHKVVKTLARWHEQLVCSTDSTPQTYLATDFRTLKKFRDVFNCQHEPGELKNLILNPIRHSAKWECEKRRLRRVAEQRSALLSSQQQQTAAASDSSVSDSSSAASVGSGTKRNMDWRQSVQELREYKDYLAPSMLAVWGYGADSAAALDGFEMDNIPTKLPPFENAKDRVGNWIDTHIHSESMVKEMPASSSLAVGTIEQQSTAMVKEAAAGPPAKASVSNRVGEWLDESEFNIFSQETTTDVAKLSTSASRPEKKKYVKGF